MERLPSINVVGGKRNGIRGTAAGWGLWSAYIQSFLRQLACLGGYLDRTCDPPPGNIVIWRGMSRLSDIAMGFQLGATIVGN